MSDRDRARRFEELAERRVNEAIKRIRLIGKLSNKSNYAYTDDHVRQIFKALDDEVKATRSRFQSPPEDEAGFKFNR